MPQEKIIALIGARGGSKGLKGKNIIDFAGRPLIAWTIDAALGADRVDRVVVSTDSDAIARVSRDCGADVPFVRPARLAEDHVLMQDVVLHALEWLSDHEGAAYDYVLVLQPTSPLRTAALIDRAIEYYFQERQSPADNMVAVSPAEPKTAWMMKLNENGHADFVLPEAGVSQRRQALPALYCPNGLIYFSPVKTIMKEGLYTSRNLPFIVEDSGMCVDIDTREDLEEALALFEKRRRLGTASERAGA